jgi:creatinine amidohydrolase
MTEFFNYADLTWPEIAGLERDTPLLIPLGRPGPEENLVRALGYPLRTGFLPSIPFGWEGSGLNVADDLFENYVFNLVQSLHEDGFNRVYVLTPPGIAQGLAAAGMSLPYPNGFSRVQRGETLPDDDTRGKVILVPIGHTEQHGYHLPMSTDTLIIDAIAQGVVSAIPERTASLPTMPYGVSTHRSSFAGTLNAGGRAFEDFWGGVIDVLAGRGFDRIYLISGHGGNCSFLANVVKYAGERHRRVFSATSWLYLSGSQGIEALQRYRRSGTGGMGHAGELETSLILHLQPRLAHMEKVVDETDFVATPSFYMDWVEGGALVANPPWDDDTATGAYGAGSLASAEHGEIWLQAAISEKAAQIEEIHEQHERREVRRKSGFGLWGRDQASR